MRLLLPTIVHGQVFRKIISMFYAVPSIWGVDSCQTPDGFCISSNTTFSAVYQIDYSNKKITIFIHISLFKAGIDPELLTLALMVNISCCIQEENKFDNIEGHWKNTES